MIDPPRSRRPTLLVALGIPARAGFLIASLLVACAGPAATPEPALAPLPEAASWSPLLEGEALGGWRETEFGGGGEVRLEEGQAFLDFGSPLTGLTWEREFPRQDFEIAFEGVRLDGNDFFCGLTFPVGDGECTLILGGWGGALTGLSSIDGEDASRNATRSFRHYPRGVPVDVRVRVDGEAVRVWLDEELIIDQRRAGHTFSLRPEVLPSAPLGFASFCTRAAVRDLRYRELAPFDGLLDSASASSPPR